MLAALANMAMNKKVYRMYSMASCVQGELGECWLLAALANMAMNKRVRAKVVPLDQSFSEEYAGIFHFRSKSTCRTNTVHFQYNRKNSF